MSSFSKAQRAKVVKRAQSRCEYCHLPTRGQVATFPIDHIIPRSSGGSSRFDNLALACPHCNAQKWAASESHDPETKTTIRYFHPRKDDWDIHFEWKHEAGELVGKTPIGRATIHGLGMNSPDMLELRQLLFELGIFLNVE
jgi:hypothetical protein